MPFRVWTSVAREGREASLSVPPPVSAPQPSMCEAALTPPSQRRPPPGRLRPERSRAPPVSTAAAVSAPAAATSAAEAKPSVASASATCCEAKRSMSCAAWRSTSAALWPARSSRGSTSLGLPMIWGAGTSSRGGASPGAWAPRDAQRAVQPVAAAPQHVHVWFSETLLVAAAAPAAAPAITVSAAWMPLSRSRPPRVGGLGGSSPSLGLAGIGAPVVAVGQEGWPGELSGRAREGDPIVALVSCFKSSCWVQGGVGQRGLANGLRGVGVIVKVPVTGSVDRSVALGQVQGEGLALLDVP